MTNKKLLQLFALLVLVGATLPACKQAAKQSFLDASNMDTTINPADNFFDYANGGWLKKAVIPETETSIGGFTDLYLETQEKIKKIIEETAAGKHANGSPEQQVGDFYAAAMDSAAIDKLGYTPVKPLLEDIDKINDIKSMMLWIANRATFGSSFLYQSYVGADEKNSSMNLLTIYQGGLGLPDRDYYFKTDDATRQVVNAYTQYIITLFKLTGSDSVTALKNASTILNIEKKIAASHRTNVELRNPQINYNKMAVADLDKQFPNIGFANYLNVIGAKADSMNIGQPKFLEQLNALLGKEPLQTWKTYLTFHILSNAAGLLSKDFETARFNYRKVLTGQQKQDVRWKRMVNAVDGYLGDALGQIYVKKHFPPEAKARMMELVNNLQKAFEARIAKLDWMSDSTKQRAVAKLNTFIKKIGYPDKWKDYSAITIKRDDYYGNVMQAKKYEFNFQVSKIGKPVDRSEWGMSAPTINAYYNPTFNEIVFPAGILQFPFFDLKADDAINYGGIGMVIGHEMTHGFDDQGAQYDKEGNLMNWWAAADNDKFKTKAKTVSDFYKQFKVLDSIPVNGDLTLGENIADMGGLAIAYDAFKLTAQGKSTEKINGFTPDQRFFMSYAQIWKEKMRDESLRTQVNTDPHSPAKFRVMGPLMHFAPFYNTFNVKSGNKMYKPEAERIKIW